MTLKNWFILIYTILWKMWGLDDISISKEFEKYQKSNILESSKGKYIYK